MVDHHTVGSTQTERDNIVKAQRDLQKAIQDAFDLRIEGAEENLQEQRLLISKVKNNLNHAMKYTNQLYQRELKETMKRYTGINADGNLTYCITQQGKKSDSLVESCPFFELKDHPETKRWNGKELIVLIHNQGMYNQSFARVRLPTQYWKAKIWSKRYATF